MLPSTPLASPPEPPVPIRLSLPETLLAPPMSLAPEGLVLPATMVSVRSAVPSMIVAVGRTRRCLGGVAADGAGGQVGRAGIVHAAPPVAPAELPLIVHAAVSEVAAAVIGRQTAAADRRAELPLMVQSVSVAVP